MGTPKNIPEDAVNVEEGLSNKVYFHEDKVYKIYRFFPVPGLYASLLELFRGRLIFYGRNRRIRNSIKMAELVRKTGFETAEILKQEGRLIVFERIEGVSGFEYLSNCTEEEASELGFDMRQGLEELHDMDVALKDARLSNFIIKDEDVYSIDHEYSSLEAGKLFKILDELTLLSSARQTSNYHAFKKGFRPHKHAVLLSIITAFYHVILFNRKWSRLKNLWRSLRPARQS